LKPSPLGKVKAEVESKKAVVTKNTTATPLPKVVKCLCVHGTCKPNTAQCSGSCEKGWHGATCHLPDDADFYRKNAKTNDIREAKVDTDEFESDIFAFKAEKIRDDMSGSYFNEQDSDDDTDDDYDYKAALKEATKNDKQFVSLESQVTTAF